MTLIRYIISMKEKSAITMRREKKETHGWKVCASLYITEKQRATYNSVMDNLKDARGGCSI